MLFKFEYLSDLHYANKFTKFFAMSPVIDYHIILIKYLILLLILLLKFLIILWKFNQNIIHY